MTLYGNYFKVSLIASVILLWLSFFGFLYPGFNLFCFLAIILITLALSWKRLELGLYIVLAELFLASHGQMFYAEIAGQRLSIRIALFLTIMLVWLIQMFNAEKRGYLISRLRANKKITAVYGLLFLPLIWGVLWGIIRHNPIGDVLNDFNGYLYLLLLFPLLSVLKTKEQFNNIIQLLLGTMSALSFFCLGTLFAFTHKVSNDLLWAGYRWERVHYLGEITYAGGGFFRVFWLSQMFLVIGLLILIMITTAQLKKRKIKKQLAGNVILAGIFLSVIIISFSRTFWLALLIALFFLLLILLLQIKNRQLTGRVFVKSLVALVIIFILSLGIIYATVNFPYPATIGDFSADMLKDRAGSFVSSRWNLLPILAEGIVRHPVIGSGFGSTLTYKTEDPRILEFFPDGNYTTYAFEWGYLELIFKLGLAGTLIYLLLIWRVFKKILVKGLTSLETEEKYILLALGAGLIALLATHGLSPYLNHPIGIGYILLLILVSLLY